MCTNLCLYLGVYTCTFCESGEQCEGLGAVGIGSGKLLTWVLGTFWFFVRAL